MMLQIPVDKAQALLSRIRARLQKKQTSSAELIQLADYYKTLKEHPGYKALTSWMNNQQDLILEAMSDGVRPDKDKGLSRLEVYDSLQRDYAVFSRIQKYVDTVIREGDKERSRIALINERSKKA